MQLDRKTNVLLERLEKSSQKADALAKQLQEKLEKVTELEQRYNARYPSPVVQVQEDIAFYEAIFDILVLKKIATLDELQHYLDQYKQIWAVLINILIDKEITTGKELNCAILAYHHFLRSEGINAGKSREQLFAERQKYIKMLMALPDPLSMIGR